MYQTEYEHSHIDIQPNQEQIQQIGLSVQALRKLYDMQWKAQKEQNRQNNLKMAHGMYYLGKYRHNP